MYQWTVDSAIWQISHTPMTSERTRSAGEFLQGMVTLYHRTGQINELADLAHALVMSGLRMDRE